MFGDFIFKIGLYPVIWYFYLTGKTARKASKEYLNHLAKIVSSNKKLTSYQHFMQFAEAILDKLSSWTENSNVTVKVLEPELWQQVRELDSGAIFLGAHLGNLDACRNQSSDIMGGKLNALMFTEHASKFVGLVKQLSSEFEQQIISVSSVGPDTAMLLQEKLANKEHIFILADRIPQEDSVKLTKQMFLGVTAEFGNGPFVLASILKAPVYFISALKFEDEYHLHIKQLETSLLVSRKERTKAINQAISEYASWLEKQCEKAPLQWYNFYPFWQATSKNK